MQNAFFIRLDGKLESISFDDVLCIVAKNNYCEIVATRKRKYLAYVTMNCMEQKLPSNLFIRVHRSYIISINKIAWLNGTKLSIEGMEIPVSKQGHKQVMKRILVICPELELKSKKIDSAYKFCQEWPKEKNKKKQIK
jgi:two-component system LytT family response regulator